MSIFAKRRSANYDAPVFEGYGCEDMGHIDIAIESLQDQEAIVEALTNLDMIEIQGLREVKRLEESGAGESVIESAMEKYDVLYENFFKNVWDKIVEKAKKMWGMIKAFFKSIIRFFQSFFMSNKKFIEKYEDDFQKLDLSGYKVKMFNYKELDKAGKEVETLFTKVHNEVKNAVPISAVPKKEDVEKFSKKKEEYLKTIRGHFVTGTPNAEQYNEKLYEYFRGAKSPEQKKEIELSKSDVVSYLKDDETVKFIKDSEKDLDAMFKDIIDDLEDFAKGEQDGKTTAHTTDRIQKLYGGKTNVGEVIPGAPARATGENKDLVLTNVRNHISLISSGKDIALHFIQAWRQAHEEKAREYMKYVRGAFHYKKKK